jgi:hypothetical protein
MPVRLIGRSGVPASVGCRSGGRKRSLSGGLLRGRDGLAGDASFGALEAGGDGAGFVNQVDGFRDGGRDLDRFGFGSAWIFLVSLTGGIRGWSGVSVLGGRSTAYLRSSVFICGQKPLLRRSRATVGAWRVAGDGRGLAGCCWSRWDKPLPSQRQEIWPQMNADERRQGVGVCWTGPHR